jgi:hypothetical protein
MANPDKQRLADALSAMTGGAPQPAAQRPGARPAASPAATPLTRAASQVDDDASVAPAPDPSQLGRVHSGASSAFESSLRMKRTLIPILLTLGVMLPITGSLKWLAPRDSAFAAWSSGLALAILAVGVCMLGIAVANMLQVKHMLTTAAARGLTASRRNS